MKATRKNLCVLMQIEKRMDEGPCVDRFEGSPALTSRDLRPGERYHADRLVQLGFLKKTKSCAPWLGLQPVNLYWRDETCRRVPSPG